MLIKIKDGKIIVTPHEIVVRIEGEHRAVMQADCDSIELIGRANVLSANLGGVKWSIKLESEAQLQEIEQVTGVAVEYR